jgi:hypothetical protein
MMYVRMSSCISPQHTFGEVDLENYVAPENNILRVIEPKYEGIPLNILRRMGKAVRVGVGTALPLLNSSKALDGIIIGTGNGGMEDCIKFLNQIMEYEEGRLTPTNFVQSTPNAIAAQIGLSTANIGYNITHVHRGLSFETALLDAVMMLKTNRNASYLVGAVDEVSSYNYNLERLGGWYKNEKVSGSDLYEIKSNGSIAGEGAAMFVMNNEKEGSLFSVKAIHMLHTNDAAELKSQLEIFIGKNGNPDAMLSGENGDDRLKNFYDAAEYLIKPGTLKLRFKHYTGEHPTSNALGLWLAGKFLETGKIPSHFIKEPSSGKSIRNILIYNSGKGEQHSFIFLEKENS